MVQICHLSLDRATKHSVRYREPSTGWIVYIPKDKLPKTFPPTLTITLEFPNE